MFYNDHSMTQEEINHIKIKKISWFAIAVSIALSILKFYAYNLTSSYSLYASAMDSLMDTAISIINLIAVYMLSMNRNNFAPFGWDKAAVLVATLQSIIISFLCFEILHESFEKLYFNDHNHIHYSESVLLVPCISFFISFLLIFYQRKIVKETGSLVIKADMIHFISDLYSNLFIFVGFMCMKYFNIMWIDSVLGVVVSIYLMSSIFGLLKTSIPALLDLNLLKEQKQILKALNEHGYSLNKDDLQVMFSGAKFIVHLKLTQNLIPEMQNLKKIISNFSTIEIKENCKSHTCTHMTDTLKSTKMIEVRFNLQSV